MRRTELLNLSWDSDGDPRIEKLSETWIVRFSRESQKSNADQHWAMPPQLMQLLDGIPTNQRAGKVFRPLRTDGCTEVVSEEGVSNTVSKIGKTAGIVVATHPIKKTKKFASLHDLRRTFATWWARRVPASILRELMRHESVQTTEDYYVGLNAQAMAEVLATVAVVQHLTPKPILTQ